MKHKRDVTNRTLRKSFPSVGVVSDIPSRFKCLRVPVSMDVLFAKPDVFLLTMKIKSSHLTSLTLILSSHMNCRFIFVFPTIYSKCSKSAHLWTQEIAFPSLSHASHCNKLALGFLHINPLLVWLVWIIPLLLLVHS